MSRDPVFEAFLARQYEEAMALARSSDLLELFPLDGMPPSRYIARFNCRGLIRSPNGNVTESDHFEVGIWFPSDYLRRAVPWEVLTWLGPRHVFHPNISNRMPLICVGRLAPGTWLVDLLFQCFEIITYQKVTMREDDSLNPGACAWAREHQARFPVDPRPLKWSGGGMIAIQHSAIERTVREGWIDLRVPLAPSQDPEFAWMLLGKNGSLTGPARFERYDAERMGIGVQVREDSPEERIEAALGGIREAERTLHGKPEAEQDIARPDEETDWPVLAAERGWALTRREDGRVTAELDAVGVMNQGFLEARGERTIVSLTVLRTAGLNDLTREAIARFVLGLTARINLVRAGLSSGDSETLRFEVPLPDRVSAGDLDLALEALSFAARLGGRECRALMEESLARRYLASTMKE